MIFPDKTLATRLETRLALDNIDYVNTVKRLFPHLDATYHAVGGGFVVYTGLPYINTAVGLGLDTKVLDSELDTIEAVFRVHDLIPQVEICPFTDPLLLAMLNQRGYRLIKFYYAYVHSLEALEQTYDTRIVVEPIHPTDYDKWVATVMDIALDDTDTDKKLAQAAVHRQHVTCFLATIDGEPAGASALSIQDKSAILHFTATRQAYRRRGVQTAMIQQRLVHAWDNGCDVAFSTSVPGNNSMRNIMRAGFQMAYTRCMMQQVTQSTDTT